MSFSLSEKPVFILNIPALLPKRKASQLMSSFCHKPFKTIFPPNTPIDPVIVEGSAMILSPGSAIK